MNRSDTLIYCVEILLDFSLIFCVRYIYFRFLLKANFLLANPSLVTSETCILTERNKYITSFCCEVVFVKISAILSSTMLMFFKDFLLQVFCPSQDSSVWLRLTSREQTWSNNGQRVVKHWESFLVLKKM